jgi:hypothetical protein
MIKGSNHITLFRDTGYTLNRFLRIENNYVLSDQFIWKVFQQQGLHNFKSALLMLTSG